jgi:hypothetical protein
MGGWRVDQTKKIRKRGCQEFSMQNYVKQNAGQVMPENTQIQARPWCWSLLDRLRFFF